MLAASRTVRAQFATVVAFLTVAASAHGQQYSFRYYGAEDGLTNLAVKVLFQDRTGYLWAGTENGVFRYDGERFQRFGPLEGLPREVVLSLGETPDGKVLAGYRGGLYLQRDDRFEKLPLPGGAGVNSYSAIQADSGGRVLIATSRGLVVATQPEGGGGLAFQLLPMPAGVDGPDTHGVHIERDTVWFGCGNQLCKKSRAGVAVFGAATVLFGYSKLLWLSIAALAVLGGADMLSVFIRHTLVQLVTPDPMRGRVAAVSTLFIGASNELGEFESGLAARFLGAVGAAIFGGVGALAVTGIWAWLFPALRRADRLE